MTPVRAAFVFMALAILLAIPAFYGGGGGELDIWQQGFFVAAVPRRILLEYRQLPFWNPWGSGGVPCLAHPYSSFLAPSYLLPLALGPVAGLKARAVLSLWLGLTGGYLLGRCFSPGRFAPCLLAVVFLLSSWYPLYLSRWHVEFIPFAYLPWLLLLYLRGLDHPRWTACGGAAFALLILEGGTYPVPLAAFFLLLYAAADSLARRSARPLAAAGLIVLLGAAISGVKLLPMLRFIIDNPRFTWWREPVLPLRALPRMFFGRDQLSPTDFRGAWLGWWEYGSYVGVVPAALAVLAIAFGRKKIVPAGLAGLVFFGVMFGDFGDLSPWRWLHLVPPFSSLHDTVRFRVPVVFCVALLSAAGLSRLEERARLLGGGARLALLAALGCLAAWAALDLALVGAPLWGRLAITPPPPFRTPGDFRQVSLAEKEQRGACVYRTFLGNEGLINNWDGLDLRSAGVRPHGSPGYRGEAWLEEGSSPVRTVRWSPNELAYETSPAKEDWLLVNQRYDPGWGATDGRGVMARGGILAVRVSPGGGDIVLRYRPPWLRAGCILSAAGLLAAIMVWRRRMRGIESGSVASPTDCTPSQPLSAGRQGRDSPMNPTLLLRVPTGENWHLDPGAEARRTTPASG